MSTNLKKTNSDAVLTKLNLAKKLIQNPEAITRSSLTVDEAVKRLNDAVEGKNSFLKLKEENERLRSDLKLFKEKAESFSSEKSEETAAKMARKVDRKKAEIVRLKQQLEGAESRTAELEEELIRFKEKSKKKSSEKKRLVEKLNERSRNLIVTAEEKRRLVEELNEKSLRLAELTEQKDQLVDQLENKSKALSDALEEKGQLAEKLAKKRRKQSQAADEIRVQLTPSCLSRSKRKISEEKSSSKQIQKLEAKNNELETTISKVMEFLSSKKKIENENSSGEGGSCGSKPPESRLDFDVDDDDEELFKNSNDEDERLKGFPNLSLETIESQQTFCATPKRGRLQFGKPY